MLTPRQGVTRLPQDTPDLKMVEICEGAIQSENTRDPPMAPSRVCAG